VNLYRTIRPTLQNFCVLSSEEVLNIHFFTTVLIRNALELSK